MLSGLLMDRDKGYQRRLEDLRKTWESLKLEKKKRTQRKNNRDESVEDREANKFRRQGRGLWDKVIRTRIRV